MCGRYRLSRRLPIIEEHFDAVCVEELDWTPRYNIAPTQSVPVIRRTRNLLRELSFITWGFMLALNAEKRLGARIFNVRSEGVTMASLFRDAVSQRCLIPADGFYQWKNFGGMKQPYCCEIEEGRLFAFAGLWDRWTDPNDVVIETCAILTTTSNSMLADLHDRMPVILQPREYDLWLDTSRGINAVAKLLVPYADHMRRYAVSRTLNQVHKDDSNCATPLQLEEALQGQLFQ